MKKFLALIISVVLAFLTATPAGKWFDSQYASGGWLFVGSFPGYFTGLLLSYVFFSALLFPLSTKKIKSGIYASVAVLIFFIIIRAINPLLWLSLILLAAGLGIAYLILLLTRKAGKKVF